MNLWLSQLVPLGNSIRNTFVPSVDSSSNAIAIDFAELGVAHKEMKYQLSSGWVCSHWFLFSNQCQ
jgi:hypothetical protein